MMGCKTLFINGRYVRFNEGNDDILCLCTFPHNDQMSLCNDRMKSLALFGAVCALIAKGHYDSHEGVIVIPDDLPEWIVEGVK